MRWLWVMACVCACAETPTQTLVRFEADTVLEDRAQTLRVRLFRSDGTGFYDESAAVARDLSDRKVPVVPLDGDAARRFRVLAELIDAGGVFAVVRAETGFTNGALREVWLRFDATCTDVECADRQSCRDGTCGGDCVDPARRGGPRPTPAYACALDGGLDAGFDAGFDAPVPDVTPDTLDCMCPCSDDVCTEAGCAPAVAFDRVELGRAHACAIDTTGGLWCWGDNGGGQIGIGVPAMGEPPPVDVPTRITEGFDGEPVTTVSLGDSATGARLRDGRLFTWGNDDFRKLGQGACCGERGRFDIPNLLELGWVTVDYGADHACGIEEADQDLECWGRNNRLQCARDSMTGQLSSPRSIGFGNDWIGLAAGSLHTCGIRSLDGGALFCWGAFSNGRLGIGDVPSDRDRPQRVTSGALTWRTVTAGDAHTCGITDMGHLYCWGQHSVGQLGVGGAGDRMQPNRVDDAGPLADGWEHVSAGYDHTCGINGTDLYCWGSNLADALGIPGLEGSANVPQRVGEGFASVGAGDDFTCAIDALGALYCWGRDDSGRLGLARTGNRDAPARVCIE